jgi:hypothetical protein
MLAITTGPGSGIEVTDIYAAEGPRRFSARETAARPAAPSVIWMIF